MAGDERISPVELDERPNPVAPEQDTDDYEIEQASAQLLNKRRMIGVLVAFVLLIVAIYVLFPKIAGLGDTMEEIDSATWYWVVVAIGFNVAAFGAYVAMFRGILGGKVDSEVRRRLDTRASYQITMAGLAATRIFSAAGAGGIAVTYWALRKAGMERRRAACRMVAFLVLMYVVYMLALIVCGILLRVGVLPGPNPVGGTIVPASIAGVLVAIFLLISLIPGDFERRLESWSRGYRRSRFARRIAAAPATIATGVRTAIDYVRHPRRGALAVGGAFGFWAANIGILWASFEAFGGDVPVGVLVQGFFIGMAANLIPSPAGGVGSVDAGMIGAFVLFDLPTGTVFPAVLTYRLIAFWLPIPPGIVAWFGLMKTVEGWQRERRRGVTPGSEAILSKVK